MTSPWFFLRAVAPWLVGFVALGAAYPLVGNSWWLCVFVVPAVILAYATVWA